jgi:hypothetical protein
MTFDNQQQKDEILALVQNEELRKQIENAKIVTPWVSESGK